MPLTLTILTPDERLFEDKPSHQVELPGAMGTFGVLEGHSSLATPLGLGEIRIYASAGETPDRRVAVAEGFAEITPERVVVTARAAERAEDIDVGRARAARDRAQKRLGPNRTDEVNVDRARAALARATNRLRVAEAGGHGQ